MAVKAQHFAHVVLGLGIGGNLVAVVDDGVFAGVIGRQRQHHIIELLNELAQMQNTGVDVLGGITGIAHAVALGGSRHQLHQADGAGPGHGLGVEGRLHPHHRVDEVAIQAQLPGNPVDEPGVAFLVDFQVSQGIPAGYARLLDPLLAPHQQLGARPHGAIRQMHPAVAIDELPDIRLGRRRGHGQHQGAGENQIPDGEGRC